MPEMMLFGRHLRIASDDLVFPGSFELFIRVLWWIGTMFLFTYHKGNSDCKGKGTLHEYLVGLLVLLVLTIVSLCAVVYVSAQGSVMKPRPRRSMPALVYLRALLYIPELVWAGFGVKWLSVDSQGCDPVTVGAVIAVVTISWIVLLLTGLVVLFVFDPLRNLHGAKGSNVWENRFHLLCCCLPQDENHQAAFSNIAKLFSDYFSVGDSERNKLVPSDVAVGLALLHQQQDTMELSRDPNVVVDHSPSSKIVSPDLESELEKAAHFMKFAAAAYGWPLYVYSNPFTGLCKLCGACSRSHAAEDEIVEGDCLGCHFSTILQSTGLMVEDFIHVSYTNEIHEKPFFVALDRMKEAVLVAVRGTLSLEDVVTDLNAFSEKLDVEGVSGDGCYAHRGMCKAVDNIYKKLINDGILNDAFSKAPEYTLVITGHSLGAGIAALLAIRLHKSYPTLQCYSFSPPGGLLSKALADYSKDFVVSVVLGKDLVPRLSISNMNDLKSKILDILNRCNKPKYRVLLKGCWYELCAGDPDDSLTEMDNRREEELSQPQQGEESVMVTDKDSQTPLRLFLPGRVLHITEDGPTRRTCCSQVRYHAVWSNELEFLSILISPRMFLDHMPDTVLRALDSLTSKKTPSDDRDEI